MKVTAAIYELTPMEEIIILSIRIEEERYKVLFTHGVPYSKEASQKIEEYRQRITELGGNADAKINIEVVEDKEDGR